MFRLPSHIHHTHPIDTTNRGEFVTLDLQLSSIVLITSLCVHLHFFIYFSFVVLSNRCIMVQLAAGKYISCIYTIICHKSVVVRKLQVAILARSPREMSLTDRILPTYILSRVRVSVRPSIFVYAKKPKSVARMLFTSIRSAGR